VIATGDSSGTVRVGRRDGREPHLLVGGAASWLRSPSRPTAAGLRPRRASEIRLWPMPDVSNPPLHTLPRDVLLARLDRLTNVRVVEDKASPGGYTVEIGPFPGWKDLPGW